MGILWGIVLVTLGLICWVGQLINWGWPVTAERLGLAEPESETEPVFWTDNRAEAAWDVLIVWTLPMAGLLLMLDVAAWAYLGLVGGAVYVYFGGRGIFTRLAMMRRGFRIGTEQNVRVNLAFLGLWAAAGLVTIAAATRALPTP